MDWDLARKLAHSERCQFLVEGLDLEAATDIPGATWEPFQLAHLNDVGLLRHERKSRQIGWSWTAAAEAVAVSHLEARSTCLFLSINREESAEKIRYARQVYEALHPSLRVPLIGDNITALVFANGSRIISMPQRPARGKAKAWVYLDEFAHYRLDREIYTGTFPTTTKGGRLRIGSTTMGARGTFWEIGEQRVRPYPGYVRAFTPWYAVSALLKAGVTVRQATHAAREWGADEPGRATLRMVEAFGSDRVLDIFDNLPLDDFEQEYCGMYVDETAAYIPWADIIAHTITDERTSEGERRYWLTHTPEEAHAALDEMEEAVDRGRLRGRLVWGLDIGRKRDTTELTVLEIVGRQHVVRGVLSLDRQMFAIQETICRHLLDHLPVIRGYIDNTGLGMQLAETLHLRDEYGERAQPFLFTNQSKQLLAQHVKTRFQHPTTNAKGRGVLIPNDRDLKYHIHSIRRRVTALNTVIFDVEHSERHHADKFWSLALANEAGERLEVIDDLPWQDTVTLRTTRTLDVLHGQAREPELGDGWTGGLDATQFAALVERGLPALLAPAPARREGEGGE